VPPRPTDLNLARVLTLLRSPLSARQREECRAIIARHVRAPAGSAAVTVDQALAALLAAAADLAAHGWGEADIRDVLDDESACLDRAGRRRDRK
jgi:hypothetical protein